MDQGIFDVELWCNHLKQLLSGIRLVVVANRAPYLHHYVDGRIEVMRPASGLTTALDPVMRATGGVWIAASAGDADDDVLDERSSVAVPPGQALYRLRRLRLSKADEDGFYYGFANGSLWPMCHMAYVRPRFQESDFLAYRRVNEQFAEAVMDEVGDEPAIVFIQDYHFALLPGLLKWRLPNAVICQFWHIPWPNPEAFRICPWQTELLDGLLGNDLLSFHIQYHCNNFLETVDRTVECHIDRERFAVRRSGQTTHVRPHAISIAPQELRSRMTKSPKRAAIEIRKRLRLAGERLIVGIDRVDYTKGIIERLQAFDELLQRRPEWKRRVRMVQVGAPSRVHLPEYRDLGDRIERLVDEINWRHSEGAWRPVDYLNEHAGPDLIGALATVADVCVVSSLHDGMNLVAKEFVALRDDLQGVLVLSRFTGAARSLTDAILVNPYSTHDFADSLHRALVMNPDEQADRMRRLRESVDRHTVYDWAQGLLANARRLVDRHPIGGVHANY